MKKFVLLICCIMANIVVIYAQTFPVKEYNCFQNFDEAATGRKDVNAYLLGYLTRIVYVQYINKDNGYTLKLTDTSKFRDKFIERTKHFFPASFNFNKIDLSKTTTNLSLISREPLTSLTDKSNMVKAGSTTYKWVWRSDGAGKNPEAMFISTPDYILVLFRGTDRVEGANPFNYDWGEWIYTDFDALDPQSPCADCPGKVHRGIKNALAYAGFQTELINQIKNNGGATKKVWITGHSLGGGFAQLFAYNLYKAGITAQGVYVYNSPHPGDVAFAAEMDRIFPNQRLQRFEFLDDPIATGPPQTINWLPGAPKWGRAGTRNYFSKETSGGYSFNKAERNGAEDLILFAAPAGALNFGGMCFHHPTWLVRSCYNLLPADLQLKLPDPPAQIVDADEGCNAADINNGRSGSLIDGGTDVVAEGTYKIKNVSSSRFLQASNSCGLNGCCDLMQHSSGAGDDVLWQLNKVSGAIFSSYTIKSKLNLKVVDADALFTGNDGCKVHLCGRLSVAVGLRTNQEWQLEKQPNGNYKIKCAAGSKRMRVAPGCASQDGCRFELHSSASGTYDEWQLIKVN